MIAILTTARLGSTRLPRKHLMPILGRPALGLLIDRLKAEFDVEIGRGEATIAIATGARASNEELERAIPGCNVFYGDDQNIPRRHLQASEHFRAKAVVAVDGDDFLMSRAGLRCVYDALNSGKPYVKTIGLPLGLNSFGYSVEFLRRSVERSEHRLLETGWTRIFDENMMTRCDFNFVADDRLRFTMDYEEDYRFFSRVFETLSALAIDINDDDLIRHVIDNQLYEENQAVAEEYWRNFRSKMDQEEERGHGAL